MCSGHRKRCTNAYTYTNSYTHTHIQWVRSCLPLVREQEQTVQERSVSGVLELIIEPIASSCASRPVRVCMCTCVYVACVRTFLLFRYIYIYIYIYIYDIYVHGYIHSCIPAYMTNTYPSITHSILVLSKKTKVKAFTESIKTLETQAGSSRNLDTPLTYL